MSLTSFLDADGRADELERVLGTVGVTIRPGGALEDLCLTLKELADFHAGRLAPDRRADLRPRFRRALGLCHLTDLILASRNHPSFASFKPHFELLNQGMPLQNVVAGQNDPSGNKTFELLVGLAALRIGATKVELDDPNHAVGDNPDVLVDLDGETWGFACKVPGGDAPATLYERVAEGVEQVERSRASRGFVVLNFKNRFDHAAVMPELGRDADGEILIGTHRDTATALGALAKDAEERVLAMANHATPPVISNLFARSKCLPGCLVISQTSVGMRLPVDVAPPGLGGAPAIAFLGCLHLINLEWSSVALESRFDAKTWLMMGRLNRALHV